jgi:hypothetical protein
MPEYETVIETAEREAAEGRYKDAYNTLGRALAIGGPDDVECRYRRGAYAYEVAHQRLDRFPDVSNAKQTLIKVGCWLSRSEAYLTSAAEDASRAQQEDIAGRLERTKAEQDRFREVCRDSGVDLFMAANEVVSND